MTMIARRKAGDPLSEEALDQLRRLAEMPDDEIDFSDIPERLYSSEPIPSLPLEEHTLTLRVDAEVAAWLETAGKKAPDQVNSLLRRAARHIDPLALSPQTSLDKAS